MRRLVSQRRSLAALVVASAAVLAVQLWFHVRPNVDTTAHDPIVAEKSVELGGHRLSYASARWDEFAAPDGSKTLSIRLDAHSRPETELCGTFHLTEVNGDRVWLPAGSAVDVDSEDELSCREDMRSYRILEVFLLPADAVGPFWLDVPVGDDMQTVRFRIGD